MALSNPTLGLEARRLYGDCTFSQQLDFQLNPRSYCIVKADSDLSTSTSQGVTLLKPVQTAITNDLIQLSAKSTSADYSELSFSVKSDGKNWKFVGTSDRKTFDDGRTRANLYRVFINPRDFKKGSKIEIVAVSRGADGKISVSNIVNYTIKY